MIGMMNAPAVMPPRLHARLLACSGTGYSRALMPRRSSTASTSGGSGWAAVRSWSSRASRWWSWPWRLVPGARSDEEAAEVPDRVRRPVMACQSEPDQQ